MGSPLAPVLAGIFMVELERIIILKISQNPQFWTRYVDDTICFICKGCHKYVLSCLSNFQNSIQFTYDIEKDKKILQT